MTSQTTPPQQSGRGDTPPMTKHVHSRSSYSHQTDRLAEARVFVLKDLGSYVPMIPFQTFLDHLAPSLRDGFDLAATVQYLKSGSGGSPPVLTSDNCWSKFPKPPRNIRFPEDQAFRPMTEIFEKVVHAIIQTSGGQLKDGKSTVDFLQNPDRAPSSTKRGNKSRPDGYLVLSDRNKKMSEDGQKEDILWSDIALSCEYKKGDKIEDQNDDISKCVWSLQHVMRDYMRRRASFGLTIENSTARVWFCCRSWVIVSDPFDFIKEPENLIKLFAAFAFADQKSLGFDPTVQPDTVNEGQFIITVHPIDNIKNPRRFRTIQILSSYGAEPLRGRGTRVYEAIEIDQNGNPFGSSVVLKDTWIDSDRFREGNVLISLDTAIDNADDREVFETTFLTRICDGNVWIDTDTVDDTAHLMRGLNIDPDQVSLFEAQQQPIPKSDELPSGSQGLCAMPNAKAPKLHPRYAAKTHYRIVFKEKGIPIHHIKSLPDVMTVLIQTVRALKLLRKYGWGHRDVSTGNILSYNGHAKLCDLEYAKNTSDESPTHDMRTGTMHFMSIEVAARKYLFTPSNPGPSSTEVDELLAGVTVRDVRPTTDVPFSHNHLHDLESLWWVAVWMVFYNYVSEGTASRDGPSFTLQDARNQLDIAENLFPPVIDSTTRQNGFQIDESFLEICKKLPDNKTTIITHLNLLRRLLLKDYKAIESGYPHSVNANASNDDIYDTFTRIFSALKTITHGLVLDSIREIFNKRLKEENKRPRSESTNDAGVAKKNQRK